MLEVKAIDAGYGRATVLHGLSLTVSAGEVLCLFGRNGAGKTTAMKAIMGLVPVSAGDVALDGVSLVRLPAHEIPQRGLGYVPQGRRLFGPLTVAENLEIGLRAGGSGPDVLERALTLFPRLRERLKQRAETLSGGERQMLATARALCLRPRVLLLDEPTEGLQPSMIEAIRSAIVAMRDTGVAILLVEQRVDSVLDIADRVAFVENGRIRSTLLAEDLRADRAAIDRYIGV